MAIFMGQARCAGRELAGGAARRLVCGLSRLASPGQGLTWT
jgi:hypothetical protein